MAHQYWRINITANVDAAHLVGMTEVAFLDGSGNPISLLGGTATASSHNTSAPGGNSFASNAFDGDISTYWQAQNVATPSAPEWLRYQFAAPVDVAGLSMSTFAGGSFYFGPRDFSLESSDDGSSTWTALHTWLGAGWNTSGTAQTFDAANAAPVTPAIIWRLRITASDGSIVFVSQLRLYDATGNLISTSAYAATASSVSSPFGYAPWFAFDGSTSDFWGSNTSPSPSAPEWIAYQFGTVQQVSRYCIHGWPSGVIVQNDATDFSLEYSLDAGSTWTVADTQVGFNWVYPPDSCWTLSSVQPPLSSSTPGAYQRGNIDWDQIGKDARQGALYGVKVQYSNGTFTQGNTPHYLDDGTLGDSGSSAGGAGIGGSGITTNGPATVLVNGTAVSFNNTVSVNGVTA